MRASPEFRKLCEEQVKVLHRIASKVVADGEEHMPFLFSYPNGEAPPIPIALNRMDKGAMSRLQRTVSMAMPCCLIVESWFITVDRPQDVDRAYDESGGTLANHPLRKESIVFSFMHRGMQLMALCKIDRETATLAPAELTDPFDTGSTGRFVLNKREGRAQ